MPHSFAEPGAFLVAHPGPSIGHSSATVRPAAAELYENMHYEQSGLSRSSLDQSISTEKLAAQAIARIAGPSKAGR